MKKELSKTEKEILRDWFESESYQVFKRVLDMRRLSIAQSLLTDSDEKLIIRKQGQAEECKNLHQYFKNIHSKN